ncbi:MAG: sugar ABC transporter substrate-binding protein [Fimbriimonas ginsengisoli]|nr:sugar ABC transporter substrate-binding protein [Fimbriimonas ginsengisoli]
MRTSVALIAALALLIGVFTLNRLPASDDRRIVIEMSVWGMPWENALYTDIYIPEFERQNPGIKVKFHHFESYDNRLLLSHAGGIAPDVMRQGITSGGARFIQKGMNLALDEFMDGQDGIDRADFIPVLWTPLRSNGKTYGIPQDINMLGLFYNKAIFDERHVSYPDSTWTWGDLKNAMERLTFDRDGDGHLDVVGLNMGWGAGNYLPFFYQAGGRVWNEDKTRTLLDSPAGVKSLEFYKSLMHQYTITQANSERGGLGPDTFFEMGKVAMLINGTWATPSLKKHAPGLRFGVSVLPHDKKIMTTSGSCYWAISTQSRHPAEAWKLAKFMSSTEGLIKYWQYLWVAPPARWSSLRSPEFRHVTGAAGKIPGIESEEEFREKCQWIVETLERGWTTTEHVSAHRQELGVSLQRAVEQVLLEHAPPERALSDAAREVNMVLIRERARQ